MAVNVTVGTYEELILGYLLEQNDGKYSLRQLFTDHSHVGSVRCLHVSKQGVLASGSSDETIHLFNLKSNVELGSLLHHQGCINGLQFHDTSHLLSASEDGKICLWQTSDWQCVKTLKGHKGPVYSLSVHPTGKLALSAGKDKTLRTWNLVTGRSAYVVNLKEVANQVVWSLDGDRFCVLVDWRADVYNVENAEVCYSMSASYRLHSAVFVKNDVLAVAGEGGCIELHSISHNKLIHKESLQTTRVKCLSVQWRPDNTFLLISASSDGQIHVFSGHLEKTAVTLELAASVNTKFRLLCLSVQSGPFENSTATSSKSASKTAKRKRQDNRVENHDSSVKFDKDKGTEKTAEGDVAVKKKKKVVIDSEPSLVKAVEKGKKVEKKKHKKKKQKGL